MRRVTSTNSDIFVARRVAEKVDVSVPTANRDGLSGRTVPNLRDFTLLYRVVGVVVTMDRLLVRLSCVWCGNENVKTMDSQ